jgi:hypothetical protein
MDSSTLCCERTQAARTSQWAATAGHAMADLLHQRQVQGGY